MMDDSKVMKIQRESSRLPKVKIFALFQSASAEVSDEEDTEPKFKYVRMTNFLQKLTKEDSISSVNVAARVSHNSVTHIFSCDDKPSCFLCP